MSDERLHITETFEEFVAKEFRNLINLEERHHYVDSYKKEEFKGFKYIFYLFMKLLNPLIKRADEKQVRLKKHKEKEAKANELLKKQDIRKRIKAWIKYTGSREVLTDVKFSEVITKSLNNTEFHKSYDYENDYILFAFVAFKVHKIGLQKFCDEVEKENEKKVAESEEILGSELSH